MPKLYELTQQYNQIFNTIAEESDFEQLEQILSGIEEAFEIKAENIAKLIKSLDGDIEAYKKEVDRLSTRKKTLENYQDRMKVYLETNMKAIGKENIKGNIFTFFIQNNPPKVIVDNEKYIPKKYKSIEIHIDKKALLDSLKNGEKIKGAHMEQSASLRIR